jgi:serine/threonine-protein phosphatase PGAM5
MSGRGSMIPIRPDVPDAEKEIDDNHVRIETAFRNYIHRADPDDPIEHEFEVFVGHGNIIRYFFCRALQLPPEAWLRLSIFNCSINIHCDKSQWLLLSSNAGRHWTLEL